MVFIAKTITMLRWEEKNIQNATYGDDQQRFVTKCKLSSNYFIWAIKFVSN